MILPSAGFIASYETALGERYYTTPVGEVPSVTTVLDATADHEALDRWRAKVGVEYAERVRAHALARGNALHLAVERHLLGWAEGRGPWFDSLAPVLSRIEEVIGVEVPLCHSAGFAGTADLIARIDGRVTVVDWKTSAKRKSEAQVADYRLQVAAYSFAAVELHTLPIERALVAIALDTEQAQVFEYGGIDLRLSFAAFRERLSRYRDLLAAQAAE